MPKASDLGTLRAEALAAVERYARAAFEQPGEFVPGETEVPVSGKVIGAPELSALADAALDGWLTEGRWADRFRARLAEVMQRRHVALVGSGSQANLLAVAAAGSHLHERPLRPGDEVITPAMGFPTTVSPLYQLAYDRRQLDDLRTGSEYSEDFIQPGDFHACNPIVIAILIIWHLDSTARLPSWQGS